MRGAGSGVAAVGKCGELLDVHAVAGQKSELGIRLEVVKQKYA
jgi:hypothetical protein